MSGAAGAIYRSKDLGERDWGEGFQVQFCICVLRCLRDIQWNYIIKQFSILGLEHRIEFRAG